MATTALTCQELVELVTDYLENRFSRAQRLRFEQHLVGCEGCFNYVEQMRDTIALTGRLSEDSIPASVREQLLAAFRDWKRA